MILYLNGEVGPEMSMSLCQHLNSLKESEKLDVYFSSPGGMLDDAGVIIDIINKYKDKIVMKGFGELSSAGFIIFYKVLCEKSVLDYTIGLAHYAAMALPSNQAGDAIPDSYDTFSYNELIKSKDAFLDFYKSIGMNKKEMELLRKGRDVHFSTQRLRELQIWQQKQKRTA